MPFLRFDLIAVWSDAEISCLLDVAHDVVVQAFGVPERDRYQVVHLHPAAHLRMEDTGLGYVRSPKQIFLQITSRPRPPERKVAFLELLASSLQAACQISPDDLVVHFIENQDADWSFGRGEAQFLTGALR